MVLSRGEAATARTTSRAANPKSASHRGRCEFRIQMAASASLFRVRFANSKFLPRTCHPCDRNFRFTTPVPMPACFRASHMLAYGEDEVVIDRTTLNHIPTWE
jgi:hypothetical protein